jgi:hypothetical protein
MSQQNELHEPVHRREEENVFFRFFVFFISKENRFFCTLEYAGCSSVCNLMGRNVKKKKSNLRIIGTKIKNKHNRSL